MSVLDAERMNEIRALRDIERTGEIRLRDIPGPVAAVLNQMRDREEIREFAKARADALQRELTDKSFF